MKLNRGDVVMTWFPHASGMRGKKRPALVVQADTYNAKVNHVLIAEITTNLNPANDPAFWKDQAARYQRAQKKLDAPNAKVAAGLGKAALDTEKELHSQPKP